MLNHFQRAVDYPDEWANGYHVMLDFEEWVTVRWDQQSYHRYLRYIHRVKLRHPGDQMKKTLAVVLITLMALAMWVTLVFAAQGQITEVNPSGIGTVSITNDGEPIKPGKPGIDHRNEAAGNNGDKGPTQCPSLDGCTD